MDKIKEQINKAQDTLSELCKNPRSFTMRVPANEERDTDLIIAKALRYAKQMHDLLEKISNWTDLQCSWVRAAMARDEAKHLLQNPE